MRLRPGKNFAVIKAPNPKRDVEILTAELEIPLVDSGKRPSD